MRQTQLLAQQWHDRLGGLLAGQDRLVARREVKPGEHDVVVEITGQGLIVKRDFRVSVPKGRVAVLVVTEPR